MAQLLVDLRRGQFDQAQGPDETAREANPADGEIVDRALRLSRIERIGRHLDRPHKIFLNSISSHNRSFLVNF